MAAASIVAIAATGALVPIAAVPLAIAWTMRRPQLRDAVFGGFVLAVFAGSLAAGELAVWSTVVATCAIGRRVVQLLEAQRSQSKCLGRIREGALVDAESRRRGMELMTTKLAHELKNPLAAIKSLVQVEAKGAVGDKSQRRLAVALAEIDRMSELIRDYLNVARPIVETSIAVVQLDELMTDVSTLLAGRAEAAGVTLVFAGDGGRLHADAQLLKEALVNIVSNAIEATPRGGEVTVHYHLGSAGASIVIRDTGRGMTKEAAARVGTPFFTTRENGTGLGVVIAKTAIAQHGGTLEYKSTPGIGTIATIVLPVEPSERKRASA
jgi:signal transduction histidine kinase